MKHLFAAALVCMLHSASQAQMPAGERQADGSVAHRLEFGTIVIMPDGSLTMALDGAAHALSIGVNGFVIETMQSKSGGIMLATAPNAEGVMLSAFFERVGKVQSASECREFYFPLALKSPAPKENVARRDDGPRAIGAYTIVVKRGDLTFKQEHRNAYLHGAGHCADVHLSKVILDADTGEAALRRVIRSVTLVPMAK